MEERYEQVGRFLKVCEDLVSSKYSEAGDRITELLVGIAASKELTGLFTAVTKDFNYENACVSYLKFPATRGASHGAAYLPSDRGELLAFVFCLLVDFDAGTRKLDDFLLRYFYVDGSYTASYYRFAERVLRPFTNIVHDCYRNVLPADAEAHRREIFDEIAHKLSEERARLSAFDLLEEEQTAVNILLDRLSDAASRRDIPELIALLTGYKYLLRYFGGEGEQSATLFALAAKLS